MANKTHICKENNGGMGFIPVLIFRDSLNEWTIEAGDGYHNIDCINYCPFCGVMLETKRPCYKCELYGECDHQGAYKKDGKWCYE